MTELASLGVERVWKYEVGFPDARCRSFIFAHHTAELLSVGIQDGTMVVWGLVRPGEETEGKYEESEGLVRLIVANTGAVIPDFPEGARFLGTVESNGVVWHVWDGDAETTA